MKRVIVVLLSVVVCFAAVSALTGCGNANADLEARIAQLEQELNEVKQEVNKEPDGNSAKVYKFGETATVYANEIPMFSITYKMKVTTSGNGLFTFTNISLPNCILDQLIESRTHSTTNINTRGITIQPTNINKNSVDITLAQFYLLPSDNFDRLFFFSPTSHLTYAIFEL